MYTACDISIDNEYVNGTAIKSNRLTTNIDRNTVINDNTWLDIATDGYHAFVVLEGHTVSHSYNHVEGLKTDNDIALYDAYLSCEVVRSHHNTWKNFYSPIAKRTFTLTKAKTGISTPTRVYEYNTYILEESYAAAIGRNLSDMGVELIDADSDILDSFEISNNTFNIYNLYFKNRRSVTIKDFIFTDNIINAEIASGNIHFVQILDYDNTVVFERNQITINQRGTHYDETGDDDLRFLDTNDQSGGTNTQASITFKDNTVVAPLANIFMDPRADVITHSGNDITVQAAYWEQDVYPTTENVPVTII